MKQQNSLVYKIILVVAVVAVVAYMGISAWVSLFRNPYSFTLVYSDTIEISVETTGWVVRNEQVIYGEAGLVQLSRSQGEKVGVGQELAVIYQDDSYLDAQEALLQLKTNLTALQYATYSESPSGTALEELFFNSLQTIHLAANTGDFSAISSELDTYRKLVLRREYLISSDATAAMDQLAQTLLAQYTALQGSLNDAVSITAEVSGLFSSTVDGYETLITPDTVVGLGPGEVEALSELLPEVEENCIGKLVIGSVWYYLTLVSREAGETLSAGDSVDVYFDALTDTISMTVESVSEPQNGQVVLLLSATRSNVAAMDLRQENGRVILSSTEGLRIPKEALRINDDGEVGVYVVLSQKARFRPVTILAEDEDGYIVAANPTDETDTRVLQAGDRLVLASDELYNGKVVR